MVILNKTGNLQAPLLPDTGLNSNLDRNSSLLPSNNGKNNISNIKDLKSQ